jgi:hypothetical protein
MNAYENLWKNRAEQHDREVHTENNVRGLKDPSCLICYPVTKSKGIEFREFWKNMSLFEDCWKGSYNWKTIEEFYQLKIIMGKK